MRSEIREALPTLERLVVASPIAVRGLALVQPLLAQEQRLKEEAAMLPPSNSSAVRFTSAFNTIVKLTSRLPTVTPTALIFQPEPRRQRCPTSPSRSNPFAKLHCSASSVSPPPLPPPARAVPHPPRLGSPLAAPVQPVRPSRWGRLFTKSNLVLRPRHGELGRVAPYAAVGRGSAGRGWLRWVGRHGQLAGERAVAGLD